MDFRALPEYIVEDIVDYLLFAVQYVVFCLLHLISFFLLLTFTDTRLINSSWGASLSC